MEVPFGTVKTERSGDLNGEFHHFPVEEKPETDVIEIDDTIFLQGSTNPSTNTNKSNICNSFENTIIYDEIVKEEPVFYYANRAQFLPAREVQEITDDVTKKTKSTNSAFDSVSHTYYLYNRNN